jgi:His/Glu/Gln/Arg/opine family amino acid ABC transporter permease subunit
MYNFDTSVIIESLPILADGIKITLFISVISAICAFIIGLITVFFRTMGEQPLKFLAVSYVEIIRNTPLLIQLYFVYKSLPALGFMLPPIGCGILALSIYTGAFISEVLRAGINSVAAEQYQASISLGLSKLQTFKLVIFPQAIRIIIPPLGSQFINVIKNSSLVSFISVTDLFYRIYKGAVDDFRFFEFFVTGALIYMILTGTVALLANIFEHLFKIQGRAVKA